MGGARRTLARFGRRRRRALVEVVTQLVRCEPRRRLHHRGGVQRELASLVVEHGRQLLARRHAHLALGDAAFGLLIVKDIPGFSEARRAASETRRQSSGKPNE